MAKPKKSRQESAADAGAEALAQTWSTLGEIEGSEGGDASGAGDPNCAAAGEPAGDATDETAPQNAEAEHLEPPAPAGPAPYRPTHSTLSAEVAHLAREAFRAKDFPAHGELHQVEMAIAHLRHTMIVAKGRLTGEPRELLEQLLKGL